MAYTSIDVRQSIRQLLGTLKLTEEDTQEYVVTISNVDIPIYFSEELAQVDLPALPFVELEPNATKFTPMDIGASVRKKEQFINIHLYFTNMDDITVNEFASDFKDYLQNVIRSNQCSVTGIDFMNIESEEYYRETDGHQIIFHYIIVLYIIYYDI